MQISAYSQTTTVTTVGTIGIACSEYTNNLNRVWNINIATNKKLVLNYSIATESGYDKINIYSINSSGTANLQETLSGSKTGSLVSTEATGKMKIEFITDGSVCCASGNSTYTGFQINISEEGQKTVFGDAIFTGKVGIGVTPTALLEISGSDPSFVLRESSSNTRLEIGVPKVNGGYAPYSVPGDVVLRTLGAVNGHQGIILNIPNILADGKSSIKFGDEKNGGWFSLYNNKIATIDGKVGIGMTVPTVPLEVNGAIKAASLSLTGALSANGLTSTNGQLSSYSTNNLYLRTNTTNRMTILNSNGYVGIGSGQPQYNLDLLDTTSNTTKAVLARLSEGRESYLGVKAYDSQPVYCKMYSIEHKFYNILNSAINFYRGGTQYGGFITLDVHDGTCIAKFTQRGLNLYGIIEATEVKISATGGADFVFNDDYPLKPLSEVNAFIQENKHLPEIPSAAEMKENNGVNIGEMQTKLLQKIEELTLYLIQQENTIQELKTEIRELKEK